MIGTLAAVFGFSYREVSSMTLGQVFGFVRVLPDVLPYINAYAQKPEKAATGEAAINVLRSLGVKERD